MRRVCGNSLNRFSCAQIHCTSLVQCWYDRRNNFVPQSVIVESSVDNFPNEFVGNQIGYFSFIHFFGDNVLSTVALTFRYEKKLINVLMLMNL